MSGTIFMYVKDEVNKSELFFSWSSFISYSNLEYYSTLYMLYIIHLVYEGVHIQQYYSEFLVLHTGIMTFSNIIAGHSVLSKPEEIIFLSLLTQKIMFLSNIFPL